MDEKEIWVLEEAGYRVSGNQPVILLFARSYKNPNVTVVHEIEGFEPYFYVPENETNILLKLLINRYSDKVEQDALGRNVRKCFTHIPSNVPKVRDNYSFTCMADYLFEKRFLIDHKIKYAYYLENGKPVSADALITEILPPRVIYFDIEVRSPEGVLPLPEWVSYPVVTIQTMDSYTNKIITFTNGVPQLDRDDHIACSDENEMFKMFTLYLEKIDPDLITGWNSASYDIPYLIRRANKIGANIRGLGRYGTPKSEKEPEGGGYRNRVTGRSVMDMLVAYKKLMVSKSERESYALKQVVRDYGFEYVDYGSMIDKIMNEERWDTLLDYGANDVIALQKIDAAEGLIAFYENLRYIAGCKLDDTMFNSRVIETLLLHEGMKPMPTKQHGGPKPEKFEGALVLLPPPGIHDKVATVDLAALYPTIMRAFPRETSPDVDMKVIEVLETVVNKREELRAKRKAGDTSETTALQEYVYKVLANSFYGVIGASTFRLFKRECAEFVTATGRDINRYIHECCREMGKTVVYSDTDSSFFKPVKDVDEGKLIEATLNQKLIEWGVNNNAKVVFSLKFEKYYERILFKKDSKGKQAAKKRYVGYLTWEEGVEQSCLNYKGLELKRSDVSLITKEIMREFLTILLIQNDPESAAAYVRKMYKEVRAGNIDLIRVSIPKEIRSVNKDLDNPWVRGKRNTEAVFKYVIPEGTKPRLIYVKKHPYEFCIDEELDIGEYKQDIDWDKILDKTVTQKLKSYVESAGIDWQAAVHGQHNLFDF